MSDINLIKSYQIHSKHAVNEMFPGKEHRFGTDQFYKANANTERAILIYGSVWNQTKIPNLKCLSFVHVYPGLYTYQSFNVIKYRQYSLSKDRAVSH